MARVDVRAVLRDTVRARPEVQPYMKWIIAAAVVLVIVAAIEFPAALLMAVAVGFVAGMLIRFAYCYVKARDASPA